LRAVRAILRTPASLDAEENAPLHFVGSMIRAMDLGRAKYQIGERRGVNTFDFLDGPVVPERGHQSFMLTGYTESVRTLIVVALLLAVFGASTQCVADCLPQPHVPPCHQHSQKTESCKHGQFVALLQTVTVQPVATVAHVTLAADPAESSVTLPARLLTILRI
jgi:hypothetical protein